MLLSELRNSSDVPGFNEENIPWRLVSAYGGLKTGKTILMCRLGKGANGLVMKIMGINRALTYLAMSQPVC